MIKNKISETCLKYSSVLAFVIIVLTIFMAYFAFVNPKVKLTYETSKMLPESDSTLVTYNKYKKIFGSDEGTIVLANDSKDFFLLKKSIIIIIWLLR